VSEKKTINDVLIEASKRGWKLFRQNTGEGWAGKMFRTPMPCSVRMNPTDVLIRNAAPLKAGLCKGSSDIIGWKPVVITPDMVGKTVAIFTAIEVKYGSTKITEEQKNFVDQVNKHGGFAKIIYGVNEL
jgi:hypothetical protein